MKRKFAGKIIVIATVLALVFSAVGVAPARAFGPFTHNEIVRQAYNLLPASGLKTLLHDYEASVMAGAVFADWGYAYGLPNPPSNPTYFGDLSEKAHVAQFVAEYIKYIRDNYSYPYDTPEAKKAVAFLFGLISHEVDDPLFHNEYMLHAFDLDLGSVNNIDMHHKVEMGLDTFNIWRPFYDCLWVDPIFGCSNKYRVEDFPLSDFPTDALLAAYEGMGAPMSPIVLTTGWVMYATESDVQVNVLEAPSPVFVSTLAALPSTYDSYWDYRPGGIMDGAQQVADAWLATWDILGYSNYTGINHAKPNGSATADCQSWQNACTLPRALQHTIPGMQVWVAAGAYKPTTGNDRKAAFKLNSYTMVYGGFPDVGDPAFPDRDPATYLTILSGDIDNNDDNNNADGNFIDETYGDIVGNNAYHVVIGAADAILDGFIITGGYANGASLDTFGAGMNSGGGMYNNSVKTTVRNVAFIGNSAAAWGGGMYNYNSASPIVTNVTFSGNAAASGGGLYNRNGKPTLANVTFSGNAASQSGGGMYSFYSNNDFNADGSPVLISPQLTNVTFKGNSAASGGGLYNGNRSYITLKNVIIGNSPGGGDCVNVGGSLAADSRNNLIEDAFNACGLTNGADENITGSDPRLGTLGDYGGATPTIPLLLGSPAIDAGDDAACSGFDGGNYDQRGMTRPKGPHCDIGAYEYTEALHVTQTGVAAGDCESWGAACTLPYALARAASADEIWVAAGVYTPTTSTTDRNATFQLKNGVAVYGGFAGTETERAQRNSAANITILSGDIDNNDANADGNNIAETAANIQGNNSYHVVTGATGATLDGFTITAGDANQGGGMYNNNSSPTVTNVTFSGNSATDGGGMCNNNSRPTVTNATFRGNSATLLGGGMYNYNSSPTVVNVTFRGNSAGYGGGMANQSNSNPAVTAVTFSDNSTSQYGGGMYNDQSNPALTNATFSSNLATAYGGGMFNSQSSPTVANVTFSGNSANVNAGISKGGGIFNYDGSNPQIRNTIFWGNTALTGTQVYDYAGSAPVVSDSVVQGGYAGGSNIITADPKLGGLGDYGGFAQTIPLQPGSSAIDAGNSTYCITGTDQRGAGYEGACDIGAYEYRGYSGIQHVKPAASGLKTCQSWEDACTLQFALIHAASGSEVWVMQGVYTPTTNTTDRTATFQLKYGVAVYGGFAGTEMARVSRDPATNVTILSGDIDNDDVNDDHNFIAEVHGDIVGNNSYHVVTGVTGATLDGFTITAGNAVNGSTCPSDGCGGGLYNNNSSPTVTNVTFSGNYAGAAGGGMYNYYSSPTVTNAAFEGNVATRGGGMHNDFSNPTVITVTFSNNTVADSGGGMYNYQSNPTLTAVTFDYDSAPLGHGGGMSNYQSSPTVTNVTFSNNWAKWGGGVHNYQGRPVFANVTFWKNSGSQNGGGMGNAQSGPWITNVTFNENDAPDGGGMHNYDNSKPQIRNTIFWNYTATTNMQIANDASSDPAVSYSVVQGGYIGTGNLSTDPRLGTLGNYGGFTQVIPLQAGSSAINTGNDSICAAAVDSPGYGAGGLDQRGMTRPQGARCDIGAYEYIGSFSTYYAKQTAGGAGNCTSWANACTLATALNLADSGNVGAIWVAAGVYTPTTNAADRFATFQLKNGVDVYGGFPNTGTPVFTDRAPATYVTILSGDINNDDSQTPIITDTSKIVGNNSYHVVTGASGATLDGFTITAGYANGSYDSSNGHGGGMYNNNSSPTVTNVTFSGNRATFGGGMYNTNSSPTVTDVTFSSNQAGGKGGGMYNYQSNPTLTEVTFSSNWGSDSGGGMYNEQSNPTLMNATFSGNSASVGGGMSNYQSSPTVTNVNFSGNTALFGGGVHNEQSAPVFANVTFSGNSVPLLGSGAGGGMGNKQSSPIVTNVTFSGNAAGNAGYGGGIFNYSGSNPQIRNTVFWGNTALYGAQVYNETGSVPVVSYSVVQDGYAGGSNIITADPKLGELDYYGGFTQVIPLQAGSSAINTGNDSICAAAVDFSDHGAGGFDQRGVTRPQGARCDIGAYEYIGSFSTYYAKQTASGAGNCTSWANACTLATALNLAGSGDVGAIWVAKGVYTPTTSIIDRFATFQLKNGVDVYGGFPDTGTPVFTDRAPAIYPTILSGDIDHNDGQTPIITDTSKISGNNSYHVVTGASGAILDGFTITAGKADGSFPYERGGGMYNGNSSPTVTQVTFSGNFASVSGGGMANYQSNPTLTDLTFSGNRANWGGGMDNYQSSPTVSDVTFSGNSATDSGGGMNNGSGSSPTLTDVTFDSNSATNYGGGMFNYQSGSLTVTNVTFSGNTATNYGGGMGNYQSSPWLTNVTFSGNSAPDGVGMYNSGNSNPQIRNTIFWNYPPATTNPQIANDSSNPVVSYSVVQGGWSGTGNLSTDPRLGTLGNYGGFTQVIPLQPGSSAINTGNDSICAAAVDSPGHGAGGLDQRGVTRPQGTHCDIGAYEAPPPPILYLVKYVSPAGAAPGQTITYTLVFANVGGGPATGVSLADTIPVSVSVTSVISSGVAIINTGAAPAYVWQVQDLAVGATGYLTVTGVLSSSLAAGVFTNTAVLTATNAALAANARARITVSNPPVANAGMDQSVNTLAPVMLDGTGSSDPDGNTPLIYGWTQTGGAAVILSSTTISQPTFTAPGDPAVLTFMLTVTDTLGLVDVTPDTVVITVTNQTPVANAGSDQNVNTGATVTLNGAASNDPDGDTPLIYGWTQTGGTAVILSSTTISQPTFTAPGDPTVLTFSLVVTDSLGLADATPDTVVITVNNQTPVADADGDQNVNTNATVTLNGTASSDPDGDTPLIYGWTQTGGPAVALNNAAASQPTFTAPGDPTVLTFTLTVTDTLDLADATPDTVVITVNNQTPVADADSDQNVNTNATVTLNGTASNDPDGDTPLIYGWTQTGGPAVTLSSDTSSQPTFTAPGDPTVLTFSLVVTDSLGLVDSTPDTVVITVTNQAPVANAGNDQNVNTGATVTLNGTASSDPDGDTPLIYGWTQTGGPAVTLSSDTISQPTFTAPGDPTVLTFTLTVTDSLGLADATPDMVVITVNNQTPVADAGSDQNVNTNATVTLNGTASSDPDGDTPLIYGWAQTGGPAVALNDAAASQPTFTAPGDPAVLTFTLTVTDTLGLVDATPDTVVITVNNQTPVADADGDQNVNTGATVTLNGTASSDPDGDTPLIYGWTQTGGPAVTLSSDTISQPTFTAPGDPTVLTFTLTVTDSLGLADATPDMVVITVNNQTPVADAGSDQNVNTNATVTLNGTASSDPDGDTPLIYGWAQTGGPAVALNDAAASQPTFTAPGDPAVLTFTLTVTDTLGLVDATPDTVVITVNNQTPVADADGDQNVNTNATVTLNGTASSDPDGDTPLIYGWTQTGGTAVILSSTTISQPTFTAPGDPAVLTFMLTVTDTLGLVDTTPDIVVITVTNQVPVANAGSDQNVNTGVTVTLNGAASSDPDGDTPLIYDWTQTGGPAVALNDAAASQPTFTAPGDPAVLTFMLTVTDTLGLVDTTPDTVVITITNQAPVANAGSDQNVNTGATVTLNGAASSDSDGDTPLIYGWAQTGGPAVALNDAAASQPTFTAPGDPTVLTFTLTVTDTLGLADAAPDTVVITITNQAPVANAGSDQNVNTNATVTLNGAASSDPDGDTPLIYGWTQTGGPAVALNDAAASQPTFTAPGDPTVLTFTLTVTDTLGLADAAPDTVVITITNQAPVANAGSDQNVNTNATVTLNGAASSDPDDDTPLIYGWTQTGGPAVTLSSDTISQPTFTAPGDPTVLTFSLVVTDSLGLVDSTPDTVVITVTNQAPVANAGNDQNVNTGATVTLNGTASSDPDGDTPLIYGWTQTGGPAVTLSSDTISQPTFTAPGDPTVLTFTLTVTDSLGLADATPDVVVITVNNQTPVADAGSDQNVNTNATVTLNGTASSDPDGDTPLIYGWTQTGGPAVTLSSDTISQPTFTAPGDPTVLTFTLTVTDSLGLADATPDVVVITVNNQTPVADADGDQNVNTNATVTLNGTASSDPDGDTPLIYGWTQTGGPAVTLSSDTISQPTFTAPGDPTVLTFTLTVTDSLGLADATPDTVVITVTATNQAPVADAGSNQSVNTNATVTLNGTASSDPDGDTPLIYGWTQTGGPAVALNDAAASQPIFTAPGDPAVLTFTLTVTDTLGLVDATPDTVVITVTATNQAPVADAGSNQSVNTNATVTLNGTASNDPDGDMPLIYGWTQTGGPAVTLSSDTISQPTFTAPGDPAVLTFTLTVTDTLGLVDATPDEVVVTVQAVAPVMHYIYLPLVMNNFRALPDLVVTNITVTANSMQVTIANHGSACVTDEFWVDAYISPVTVPTAVNQLWPQMGSQGLVWGVTASALPLCPGQTLTLTGNDSVNTNPYYWPSLSAVAWPLAVGTPVYAQVDSANADTTYGAVFELHEFDGSAYNNIVGPLTSAAAGMEVVAPVVAAGGSDARDKLPPRP